TDKAKMDRLVLDLTHILFQSVNHELYLNKTRFTKLGNEVRNLDKQLTKNLCKPADRPGIEEKLSEIITSIEKIKEFSEQAPTNPIIDSKANEAHFKEIAKLIVSALKESRVQPTHYPKYLPEQALLVYFLKKFDKK